MCVDQGRCHEETACELFGNDIENFRLIYREFLDEWDALWQTGVSIDLDDFFDDCDINSEQSTGDEFACDWLRTSGCLQSATQFSEDVTIENGCASLEAPSLNLHGAELG